MLCLLYSSVNQLQACTCPLPPDLLPAPTPALSVIAAHRRSSLRPAAAPIRCLLCTRPCVSSLRLPLYSRPADGFIHAISLDSICRR